MKIDQTPNLQFSAAAPDAIKLLLKQVEVLAPANNETVGELQRALGIAYAAALRLHAEIAGFADGGESPEECD